MRDISEKGFLVKKSQLLIIAQNMLPASVTRSSLIHITVRILEPLLLTSLEGIDWKYHLL